jgi:hypothetical protein
MNQAKENRESLRIPENRMKGKYYIIIIIIIGGFISTFGYFARLVCVVWCTAISPKDHFA